MTAEILYKGELRCEAVHTQSQTLIETDAPTDNRGKGEKFSPTDLLCVSLATCIITTIAIKATDLNLNLSGSALAVKKHMYTEPRRVGKIEIDIKITSDIALDEKNKTILQRVGEGCPVKKSLHPDLEVVVNYIWG
jgi:putative redox protein